jgi:hypothetical protein
VINVNIVDDAANGLTDLAALAGDSDPSAMIGSAPEGLTGGMAGAHRFVGHFPRPRITIS